MRAYVSSILLAWAGFCGVANADHSSTTYQGSFTFEQSREPLCQSVFSEQSVFVKSFFAGPTQHTSILRFEDETSNETFLFSKLNLIGRIGVSDVFYEKSIEHSNGATSAIKAEGFLESHALYLEIEVKRTSPTGETCAIKGEYLGSASATPR
jgi:hypothetical protein